MKPTTAEHGDGVLRACQQYIRSVRFARYSAQELTAASESLLFGTVGDIDRHIRAIELRADDVETSQQEARQLPQKQHLPGKRASTPTSRLGNAHVAQRSLIRLWHRLSKHVHEPSLTMITTSGAGSSNSRTVAPMASSERLKAYELIAHERIRVQKMRGKTMIDLDSADKYHAPLPRVETKAS